MAAKKKAVAKNAADEPFVPKQRRKPKPLSERSKLAGVPRSEPPAQRAATPEERVHRVLARIASGQLVRRSCEAEGIDRETLYRWRDASAANATAYARARSDQADAMAEECIDIADDKSRDVKHVNEYGELVLDTEFASRSRLRFDARKWLVATIDPKRYGKQTNVDVTTGGVPIADALRAGRERVAKMRGES